MESTKDNYIQKAAALKYNEKENNAPIVTAKGKGETAKQIIKIAKANELPIRKDEDLVELLSKVELDREIPTELYKAVAEIFSFIYEISRDKNKDEQ